MSFTQAHALVIGVGTHQYAPAINVPITVEDAKAVAGVLQDGNVCGYPAGQVRLLEQAGATKKGILEALERSAQTVQPGDTFFLFFCGHGALGTDGNYYLVCHDARVQAGRVVQDSGVSEKELLERLKAIQARRTLMIFNACFAGNISPTLDIEAETLPADMSNALLGTGEGRILITACRESQYSHIGSGPLTIFTQALVDGLRGKGVSNHGGYISAYSLYEHIYEMVKEAAPQEPELTVLKGVGPFAVALYKGAQARGAFDDSQPVPELPAVRQVAPEKAAKYYTRMIAIDTGGGAYIGGSVQVGRDFVGRDKIVYGDEVHGDKIGGDKISVGDISGSSGIAIGRGAQAVVQNTGMPDQALERLFAPLAQVVKAAPAEVQQQAAQKAAELKAEIKKGKQGSDEARAALIEGLVGLVPAAAGAVVSMFTSPALAGLAGPVTGYILKKIQGK